MGFRHSSPSRSSPVAAIVAWSRGGFDFLLPHPCVPTQGALCIRVSHDHLTVNDVFAEGDPSQSSLAGNSWRFVLTVGGSEYPGRTQEPIPPVACHDANGNTDSTSSACYRTEEEAAADGSFAGFSVPNVLTSATQLCISVQVETVGTWSTMTTPGQACTSVS